MDNLNKVEIGSPIWIAQQRENYCGVVNYQNDVYAISVEQLATMRNVIKITLDALEASMQREAEKDATITTQKNIVELLRSSLARLTAERDAVPEIDLRLIQPRYMGVCTTDDEDGIQIRKVSHNHPQGRGYLDEDEDVQDVVIVRFADTAQVMAVVDRLTILAETMAEKVCQFAENAPEVSE